MIWAYLEGEMKCLKKSNEWGAAPVGGHPAAEAVVGSTPWCGLKVLVKNSDAQAPSLPPDLLFSRSEAQISAF